MNKAVKRDLGFDPADCPVRNVLDRVGDQWTLLALETLDGRVLRFNELLRGIGDISKQMLSRTLRRMEEDGFVTRTVYPEVPPRVEYELTDLGRSLLLPMKGLIAWANENHARIRMAREAFARE